MAGGYGCTVFAAGKPEALEENIMEPILLYDTTLRDGTQGEDVSFSAEEKLLVARIQSQGHAVLRAGPAG